jgi:uncharacterized membrane protein
MGRALRLMMWTAIASTIMLVVTPIFAQEEVPVCPADLSLNLSIHGVVLEQTATRAELDFTVCNGSGLSTELEFVASGAPEGWAVAVRPNFGPYDITNITLAAGAHNEYRLRITPPIGDIAASDFTFTPAFGEQKLIASLSLTPNGSQRVKVTVRPALLAAADSYPIFISVDNDDYQADIVLETTLTGSFELLLTTPDSRLNVNATRGKPTTTTVRLINTGTADLRDVRFSASTPANWAATFSPDVTDLDRTQQIDPNVTITPPSDAVPGDYIITVRAQTPDTTDTVDLRVTVEESSIWQWFGIALVVIVVGGMLGVFVRLGRR